MSMKRTLLLIILTLTAVSCNPDAFIEPFEVELSGTVFVVPCSGGSVEIVTSHADWSVRKITEDDSDDTYFDGSRLDDGWKYWSETIGVVRWEIERPEPTKLIFTVTESLSPEPVCITLYIGTEYLWKAVTITISACTCPVDEETKPID